MSIVMPLSSLIVQMTILRSRPETKSKGYCFLFLNKTKKNQKLKRCEFSPSYVGKAKQHQIKAPSSSIQYRCERLLHYLKYLIE